MTPDTITNHLLNWLLAGDVAIQYQACCDLLDAERPERVLRHFRQVNPTVVYPL